MALAIWLRMSALHWGLPTDQIPHRALHPDETWGMRVLGQINPEAGDWNPEEAHREGPLSSYLWVMSGMMLKQLGIIPLLPHEMSAEDGSYATFLFYARALTSALGVLSVILVFCSVLLITSELGAALFAGLVHAVCPFEIIYGRYMRTHVPSNFFICLVIFLSCFLYRSKGRTIPLIIGTLVGLCGACRYPTVIVGVIPALMILIDTFRSSESHRPRYRRVTSALVNSRQFCLLLGIPIGLFIGAPFLFLDYASVHPHLMHQSQYASRGEFSLANLFDLSRLGRYLTYLVPYGAFPALWLIYYSSCAVLVFRRRYHSFAIPVALFLFGFLYGMGKGYLSTPIFIRAVIPLFPAFAILCGLAWSEVHEWTRTRRALRAVVLVLVTVIIAGSAYFDISYAKGMSKEDARITAYRYLLRHRAPGRTVVALFNHGLNYFIATPALELLPKNRFLLQTRNDIAENPGDAFYALLVAFDPSDFPKLAERLRAIRLSGKWVFERKFANPVQMFGIDMRLPSYPHDLAYPFPILYLFRRNLEPTTTN